MTADELKAAVEQAADNVVEIIPTVPHIDGWPAWGDPFPAGVNAAHAHGSHCVLCDQPIYLGQLIAFDRDRLRGYAHDLCIQAALWGLRKLAG